MADDSSDGDCALCQEKLSKDETITLVRDDGIATCNRWAKKRSMNVQFEVSSARNYDYC